MKNQVKDHLMTSEDGTRHMIFEEFQILMGYIARLAKTCPSGFVHAHSTLSRLGEATESQFPMVHFTPTDLSEMSIRYHPCFLNIRSESDITKNLKTA